MFAPAANAADVPLVQGFEGGGTGWTTTGQWHVQAHPETVSVASPAINPDLVTLPDAGALPAAAQGDSAAWFGEASTGTYCGADFMLARQHPQNGCSSTGPQRGELTSPAVSLAGEDIVRVAFSAWWEIEAVNADVADLMRVEYSADGGATWTMAGLLNPAEPAWGGGHQQFTDAGSRASGSWRSYVADISAAAGSEEAMVRFSFDSLDAERNGFRGWLVDSVALVDELGAPIGGDVTTRFADPGTPNVSVANPFAHQNEDGSWDVTFDVELSVPSADPVTVDYDVKNGDDSVVTDGTATVPAGDPGTTVTLTLPPSGGPLPFTIALSNPAGGTLAPVGSVVTAAVVLLPVMTLTEATLTDAGPGELQLDLGVSLAPPSANPATAQYVVTDATGTVVTTGSISVPSLAGGATESLTVPADRAPYTVTLTAPTNAVLGSVRTTTVFPPASAQATAEQLVLGVRQGGGGGAGGGGPQLGRTFLLTYVGGTVRYKSPGGEYISLTSGNPVLLPFGTVVDTRRGRARVTVESDSGGARQDGEFYEGIFGVYQRPERRPTVDIRLGGGSFAGCPGAARTGKKKSRRSATSSVRRLWGKSNGRFRTRGRFAAATVRGTGWLTEDLCLATRVRVTEGSVSVFDFRRKRATLVRAGDSITVGALQSARYRKRRGINPPRISRGG